MKSEIDMCVRFDKDGQDNIRFQPSGILRQSYNNDCDDNIENKANLSVEKRMFGENQGRPDKKKHNDGLNWFAGSNDLDALTQPEEHQAKDLIIKANKKICGINVDFSINDNKTPEDEPDRLITAEHAQVRVKASVDVNGVEVLGEIGTSANHGENATDTSGYTQANKFNVGVGVKTEQNFFGIKNLIGTSGNLGNINYNAANNVDGIGVHQFSTKLLVGGKLNQFTSDLNGIGNSEILMELGPHLLSSDYKVWTRIFSDKNADGWCNYLTLYIDTNLGVNDCASVDGICNEKGQICATIGMARFNNVGKKQEYLEIRSDILQEYNGINRNNFSLCLGQVLEIC